ACRPASDGRAVTTTTTTAVRSTVPRPSRWNGCATTGPTTPPWMLPRQPPSEAPSRKERGERIRDLHRRSGPVLGAGTPERPGCPGTAVRSAGGAHRGQHRRGDGGPGRAVHR